MKKVRLFAIVILATGGIAAAAIASGVTLPHRVRWGQALLPAGNYFIHSSTINLPATVQSMDGTVSTFVFTTDAGDSQQVPGSLTIVTGGNEWRVVSMNLPVAGSSLASSPSPQAESETLTKAKQIETVPLVAAK